MGPSATGYAVPFNIARYGATSAKQTSSTPFGLETSTFHTIDAICAVVHLQCSVRGYRVVFDHTVYAAALVPGCTILAILTTHTSTREVCFWVYSEARKAGKTIASRMPGRGLNVM